MFSDNLSTTTRNWGGSSSQDEDELRFLVEKSEKTVNQTRSTVQCEITVFFFINVLISGELFRTTSGRKNSGGGDVLCGCGLYIYIWPTHMHRVYSNFSTHLTIQWNPTSGLHIWQYWFYELRIMLRCAVYIANSLRLCMHGPCTYDMAETRPKSDK